MVPKSRRIKLSFPVFYRVASRGLSHRQLSSQIRPAASSPQGALHAGATEGLDAGRGGRPQPIASSASHDGPMRSWIPVHFLRWGVVECFVRAVVVVVVKPSPEASP